MGRKFKNSKPETNISEPHHMIEPQPILDAEIDELIAALHGDLSTDYDESLTNSEVLLLSKMIDIHTKQDNIWQHRVKKHQNAVSTTQRNIQYWLIVVLFSTISFNISNICWMFRVKE
eukprot:234214_1